MLTVEQKAHRQNYLGGTDIPAILGVDADGVRIDPYRTALEVYLEKKGEIEGFQGNIHTQAGLIFEKSILEFYEAQENVVPLKKLDDKDLEFVHQDYPFLIGHPDAIDEQGGIIDAKNIGQRGAFKWGDPDHLEMPRQYIIQAFYYMALANSKGKIIAPYAKVVAYFGGSEIKVYTIPYNAAQGNGIISQAVRFWDTHIVPSVAPDPITYSEVTDYFKSTPGVVKESNTDVLFDIEVYKSKKATIDQLEKTIDHLKLRIGTFLGSADTLIDSTGNKLVTFKEQGFQKSRYKKD